MSPALPFVRLLPRLPLVSSLEEMRGALITRGHGVGVAGGNTALSRIIASSHLLLILTCMNSSAPPPVKRTRESLAAGGK